MVEWTGLREQPVPRSSARESRFAALGGWLMEAEPWPARARPRKGPVPEGTKQGSRSERRLRSQFVTARRRSNGAAHGLWPTVDQVSEAREGMPAQTHKSGGASLIESLGRIADLRDGSPVYWIQPGFGRLGLASASPGGRAKDVGVAPPQRGAAVFWAGTLWGQSSSDT
jgi:hypothetical protein